MKWVKLSEEHGIDVDAVIFTEWRQWTDGQTIRRALDVYLSTSRGISLPEEEGVQLLKEKQNESS